MDICMDIDGKSVDMDMDVDGKFHIHGKPARTTRGSCNSANRLNGIAIHLRTGWFICVRRQSPIQVLTTV